MSKRPHLKSVIPTTCGFAIVASVLIAHAQDDLPILEERAIKAAAARVEPSVVRIESIGTIDRVGDLEVGTGPTTGLIISPDGYIVASEFNFASKPESILVTIPGKGRVGAKLVATDFSRKLVLLKVEADRPLPVPEAVPSSQVRVGQWAIALGRTYEDDRANISIGVISAVGRIWSKAIQTDAKISPNNYGGPLVDISGRVFGVLTSLGPDMMQGGGSELYDSGIGFAVPLEHIQAVLPRWQKGDLKSGILGISTKGTDQFTKPVEIAVARAGSPAFKAGLRASDTIVEADGKPITRQTEFKHQLGPLYAGDHIKLAVLRGEKKERIEADVELTDSLAPYHFPFIGILPKRAVGRNPEGVFVRYVFPDSPAAAAGIELGDEIVSFAGVEIKSTSKLAEKLAEFVPDDKAAVEVRRAGKLEKLTLVLGRLSTETPEALPPAYDAERPAAKDEPKRGVVPMKIAEFPNEAFVFVPETYRAEIPHGVVAWFPSPADWKQDDIVARWKPLCEAFDLIVVAPKPKEKSEWQPADVKFARRLLDEVLKSYEIDRSRIVAHGHEGGGALAYVLAMANSDIVRGVAVVDASLPAGLKPPEINPVERLLIWSAHASKGNLSPRIAASLKLLSGANYPISEQDTGEAPRYLNAKELQELARWIDSLDRL